MSFRQYAYKLPENHRLPTSTSTHTQSGTRVFHHTHIPMPRGPPQQTLQVSDPNVMPPPSSRFKPAQGTSSSNGNSTTQIVRQPVNMAPPQTPQHYPVSRTSNLTTLFSNSVSGSYRPPALPTGMPSTSSGQRLSVNAGAPQRFFPSPAVAPRTGVSNSTSGRPGQRMPFVPHDQEKR